MIVLIGILFSFSLNAVNSLHQLYQSGVFSSKKVHVDVPSGGDCSNDLLSEDLETENDNEDSFSEAFVILPFSGPSINAFISQSFYSFQDFSCELSQPIYLSVRTLRI